MSFNARGRIEFPMVLAVNLNVQRKRRNDQFSPRERAKVAFVKAPSAMQGWVVRALNVAYDSELSEP